MSHASTLDVGLDVHQESIAVASVAKDHDAAVIDLGTIGTRPCAMDHLIRTMPSTAQHLVFGYDAGPCGSWLDRYFTKKGYACWVVAPSLLPNKPGDRVNTDRRDAVQLARLMRAGDLTRVDVPTGADEASRDLTRARADPRRDRKSATCRLKACWLRQDSRDVGRATWHPAHRRWRSAVVGPTPAQPIVCQAYVRAVTEHTERLHRLEQARPEQGTSWRLHPVVDALQALRGVPCTAAVTMVAASGDLTRVATPRERMTCLGLIPSASSSGEQRRQGSITTAGHTHARRVLVEGAWASRYPAQVSRHLPRRLETPPKMIQDIRWKAQVRRCTRSRQLVARGTHPHVVTVAMARELTGFMWAMATQVPLTPSSQEA
jgi:transposase